MLAKAPAIVPFLRYDESTGSWTEVGTLTRSGSKYMGTINHFSVFNADTEFGGSACVKVILDPDTFTAFPYALDATYVNPASGQFNHNGSQVSVNPIGVERMAPNVNFTLDVYDATNTNLLKSVTLELRAATSGAIFRDGSNAGLDIDSVNYSHCNGPVTIYQNSSVPTGDLTYPMPIFSERASFRTTRPPTKPRRMRAPRAQSYVSGWLTANGFTSGEPQAIYFNNGDLKFGRNMHCRVTNIPSTGGAACYVSNYGKVGEDDSGQALIDARTPGQAPVATVAMEYNPEPDDRRRGGPVLRL